MENKFWLMIVLSALLGTAAWAQNAPAAGSTTNSAKQYFAEAQKLSREGKYDDALVAFGKGIKLEPYNEAAVLEQNRIFMELNRPDDALKMWDEWIELKPDDPQRWLYKMMVAGETDRGDQALKAADKLTQLQPDKVTGWKAKGQCLAGMNRNEEALQAVDRAITLDPMDDDSWRIRLAAESNLKNLDSSITFCSTIFAQHPQCIVAVYDRAGLYAMKGDKAKALADLKSALAIRSDAGSKAFARQDERFKSLRSDPEFQQLFSVNWHRSSPNITLKVVKADSQETAGENGAAANAVDGNPETYWHTQWQDATPRPPHEIVIELIPASKIKGFTYLPRQDDKDNGTIKDYEFFVSNDGKDFGAPVAKGTFTRDKDMKTMTFDAKLCRFIKLKALSEVNDQPWTSAAEIDVVAEPAKTKPENGSAKDANGLTPLHQAAAKGQKDVVAQLLANGADVNARANDGATPLHWAVYNGHKDVVELLLANKAPVNARGRDGYTPLHWAAAKGFKEIAELLGTHQADVNAKNDKGETPLQLAQSKNHPDMVELLRSVVPPKPNPETVAAKDTNGMTTIHTTVQTNKVATGTNAAGIITSAGFTVTSEGFIVFTNTTDWENHAKEMESWYSEGAKLTAEEARALEAKWTANPKDEPILARLLCYRLVNYFDDETNAEKAGRLYGSLIEMDPYSRIASAECLRPLCPLLADPKCFEIAAQKWIHLAQQHPTNNSVIHLAGTFLMHSPEDKSYVQKGEALLQQLPQKDSYSVLSYGHLCLDQARPRFDRPEGDIKMAAKALTAFQTAEKLVSAEKRENTQPDLLSSLTEAAFWAGEYPLAEKYAVRWLEDARQRSANSAGLDANDRLAREMDLGDAIHEANSILGEIALSRGDTKKASDYLIASGKVTRPSPVLASYGPDLALMRDLLASKNPEAVVQFLDECTNFWKYAEGRPTKWKQAIQSGGTPDFGTGFSTHFKRLK